MKSPQPWRARLRAFLVHLCLSLAVALLAAALVLWVWYPAPFGTLSGGRELFLLVAGVDVVVGPLLTLVVCNPAKSWREKLLDFSLIGTLQMAALVYGLATAWQARPVHAVFEYDRVRVVHANDVVPEMLARAPAGLATLPATGPTWLALRPLQGSEMADYTLQALGGIALAAQPQLWQPWAAQRTAILAAARPATELPQRFVPETAAIERAIGQSGRAADALRYLPIQGRRGLAWTVLLDAQTAAPLAFVAIDSF